MISYGFAVMACVFYGLTTIGESAVVTAGALGSADPDARGATLAVHSTLGFGGAVFGPFAFGLVLDLAGDGTTFGWTMAFAHMGVVMLLGPVVLAILRPARLPGDR